MKVSHRSEGNCEPSNPQTKVQWGEYEATLKSGNGTAEGYSSRRVFDGCGRSMGFIRAARGAPPRLIKQQNGKGEKMLPKSMETYKKKNEIKRQNLSKPVDRSNIPPLPGHFEIMCSQ